MALTDTKGTTPNFIRDVFSRGVGPSHHVIFPGGFRERVGVGVSNLLTQMDLRSAFPIGECVVKIRLNGEVMTSRRAA
ncbi:hypothetical protein TNCT_369861 [Trichonephila clavata]|uniref:Uncharacterized protein n=1 Tax=Trichonephila clavata TaxID=2740835 RepID=A0A8X6H0T7_TRICU|nr:hypothetical protein TNCT_369861 [Trichonephila clavata]